MAKRKPKKMTRQEADDLAFAEVLVEGLATRADGFAAGGYPWWHGWAVRDAFLAGVRHERERAKKEAERDAK